jgi:TrmH family RNA methyltransferase
MLSRTEEKAIRRLGSRRQREREGLFVAEGVRVVEELIDAGIVLRTVVIASSLEDTERGRRLRARLEDRATEGGAGVREVTDGALRKLADTATTQGVLVVAEAPDVSLRALQSGRSAVFLVLDGVQDPGNVGTLARSAAAFGCGAVICLPGTVDPWNPKVVRASAGAVFRLPVVQVGLSELDDWLRDHGVVLIAAAAGGEPVGEGVVERLALVLGNEGAGLSEAVAARCVRAVSIPMKGGTESLNVAVAGAILLYELTRERG